MAYFLEFEYRLFIEKKEQCNTGNITRFIREYVHDVKLERETSSELVFGIKRGASQHIGQLINALDEQRQDIDINSYGLSMTTIEEVFLKSVFYSVNTKGTIVVCLIDILDLFKKKKTELMILIVAQKKLDVH
jgi:hypoxanthine-guanine phosphoribosyltransferase